MRGVGKDEADAGPNVVARGARDRAWASMETRQDRVDERSGKECRGANADGKALVVRETTSAVKTMGRVARGMRVRPVSPEPAPKAQSLPKARQVATTINRDRLTGHPPGAV